MICGDSKYEFNNSPDTEAFFFNLRRNVPYFYNTLTGSILALVSALTTCFPLTMAISGFSPYRCLQPDDAPAEYISWGARAVSHPPPPHFLGEKILHETINMHLL